MNKTTQVKEIKTIVSYTVSCYDDKNIKGSIDVHSLSKNFIRELEKFLIANEIEYHLTTTTKKEEIIYHD